MQLRFVDRSAFYFDIPGNLTLSDDLDSVQERCRTSVVVVTDWLPNNID